MAKEHITHLLPKVTKLCIPDLKLCVLGLELHPLGLDLLCQALHFELSDHLGRHGGLEMEMAQEAREEE